MKNEKGKLNENASVDAWLDEDCDQLVIVIQTECGGYYETTLDFSEIKQEFYFIPEGC